jgi:hypothetical protein
MQGKVNKSQHVVEYLAPKNGKLKAAPASYVPMVYHGGPLLTVPELVSFYWGAFSQSDIDGMQAWLGHFAAYLSNSGAPSGEEQPIQQYGTFGASVGAHHLVSTAPASATEADVKAEIQSLQASGALPAFGPERLFLVFTKGVSFSGYGTVWCGYHGSWGSGIYFAIIPYPTVGGCGSGTPVASWQSITSHEILEAATDPSVGSGWTEGNEEGGDTCAWQEVVMPFGTVQRFADNLQQACSVWTLEEIAPLSVDSWAANRLDVFARGTDGAMYHQAWDGHIWSAWENRGGQIT